MIYLLVIYGSLCLCGMHLRRFNDFGTDGGPAAKELDPKLAVVQKYLNSKLGEGALKIDVRLLFSSLVFIFYNKVKKFSCTLLWT